jgi:hypothetical protein
MTCHLFQFFEFASWKLATNIFDLPSLILGLCLNVYLLSQKIRAAFFDKRGKRVYPAV